MLSVSSRDGGGGLVEYLSGDKSASSSPEDYYSESGGNLGEWHGAGASSLGLDGAVSRGDFEALALGLSPDGSLLVARAGSPLERLEGGGTKGHKSGWDLTFSAPKSVSVVWGLANPKAQIEIEKVHDHAVKATLDYAQKSGLFESRRGKQGKEKEAGGSPVFSLYRHGTSREQDMQLHTHSFLHNVLKREDGSFSTIDARSVYRHKIALGAAYRSELSAGLQRLGYSTEKDEKGSFKLSSVPDNVNKEFSRRREQIEKALADKGFKGGKASEIAALNTRQAKSNTSPDLLREDWKSRALSLGLSAHMIERSRAHQSGQQIDQAEILFQLTERTSTFEGRDLLRAVGEKAQISGGGIDRVEKEIAGLKARGEVIQLLGGKMTTREMLEIEQSALATAHKMTSNSTHQVPVGALNKALAETPTLSVEQVKMIGHVTSDGGLKNVIGDAGTGKSFAMRSARGAWENAGYTVRGVALAGKAASGLQGGSGIRSQTLHSLLADLQNNRDKLTPKTVVVLDEAGMIGSRQMSTLIENVSKSGAKLVLVGDPKQLQAIDAGGIFRRLSDELGASKLEDIRRQTSAGHRQSVKDFAHGKAEEALKYFSDRGLLRSGKDHTETMEKMVSEWSLSRNPERPGEHLLLAATRADVRELNQLARESMRDQGRLSEDEHNYGESGKVAEGDRVKMTRNSAILGVKNGDLGTVKSASDGRLTLEMDSGREVITNSDEYDHITHGYAITLHAAQGATVDRAAVLLDQRMSNREWSYVSASRSREETVLYGTDNQIRDLQTLSQTMSRSEQKSTSLDHLPPSKPPPMAQPLSGNETQKAEEPQQQAAAKASGHAQGENKAAGSSGPPPKDPERRSGEAMGNALNNLAASIAAERALKDQELEMEM